MNPKKHQQVFFSFISYAENAISSKDEIKISELPKFALVTGIANAKPLVDYLKEKGLQFDHMEYPDHYAFKSSDIGNLEKRELIVTTEKDYMRLSKEEKLDDKLYYLPISLKINNTTAFEHAIKSYVN